MSVLDVLSIRRASGFRGGEHTMSAYMCADDTFNYLAGLMGKSRPNAHDSFTFYLNPTDRAELVQVGILEFAYDKLNGITDVDALVAILRRENLTSLVARYGEKAPGDAGDYACLPVPRSQVKPVVALKSLACLDYQSCEHPNYNNSIAKRLITALESHAIGLLPGYDDAPWGWTREDETAKA